MIATPSKCNPESRRTHLIEFSLLIDSFQIRVLVTKRSLNAIQMILETLSVTVKRVNCGNSELFHISALVVVDLRCLRCLMAFIGMPTVILCSDPAFRGVVVPTSLVPIRAYEL